MAKSYIVSLPPTTVLEFFPAIVGIVVSKCPEANPNWEEVETDTKWENQQRNQPEPENVEEEEGFQETHCSPLGASRCKSHPDVEIVSSAQS